MMTDYQLDKATADHLAAVIAAIRTDWEPRGIVAALAKVRTRPLAELTVASVLASTNTDAKTPAVIAMEGDHWRRASLALSSEFGRHPSSVPFSEACVTCGRSEEWCRIAPRLDGDDHQFLSRHQAAIQRARTDRRAANRPPTTTWDPAVGSYISDYRKREITAELTKGRTGFVRRQAELEAKRREKLAGAEPDPIETATETVDEPRDFEAELVDFGDETATETEPELDDFQAAQEPTP